MPKLIAAALLLSLVSLTACHSHPCSKCGADMENNQKVLRHVVAFKFKKTATPEQVQGIVDDFAKLPDKIDSIVGFEHGTNISEEGHDQGFTHVFTVTFKDKAGLETYLPHPAHKAFVEKLLPLLEQPFVVDYYAQ